MWGGICAAPLAWLRWPGTYRRGVETPSEAATVTAPDGERDALRALLAPHWPLAVSLAHRLAPADRAEEVLRETVRAAWRHREQFDPSPEATGMRTWLLAVVADVAHERSPRGERRETGGARYEQRVARALHGLGLTPDAVAEVLGCDGARAERLIGDQPGATAAPPDPPEVALDPLLAAAAARKPRRSRTTWIGVGVVVALGIAVPVIALTTRSSGHKASTATRVVQVDNAGFTGAVLDPDNPKRLYVLVTERAGDAPCLLQNPTATVSAHTADAVTITVGGLREVPATAAPGKRVTYACRATVYVQVSVDLSAPLDGRQVVDAASGTAQPVLDPRTVPTPGYVPSGYQAQPVTWQPGTGTPDATAAMPEGWAALRSYTKGPAELDVRVAAPTLFEGANPVGHATVAGSAATITQSGGTLCMTWPQTVQRSVQVCSAPDTTTLAGASASAAPPDTAPLDQQELLRVARSLP